MTTKEIIKIMKGKQDQGTLSKKTVGGNPSMALQDFSI